MANYSIVSNAKFRPFTYQEMLQPVLAATQAHQALEEAYANIDAEASIWDRRTEGSERAHNIYSNFSRDLINAADALSKYGLNPQSRREMLNMRSRYAKDMLPIAEAYKKREEHIAEQRKAGNSMIYDYDASTKSLDAYLDNPALTYKSIDRKDLYTRAINDFSHISKALNAYDNGKRLDAYTKTFLQEYGIRPEQAREFIDEVRSGNLTTANPILRAIYSNLYNSTNVDSWNNPQASNTVMNTILEGVGAAIGQSNVSLYEDRGAVMARQLANQRALAREEANDANKPKDRIKTYSWNNAPLYTDSQLAKRNKETLDKLDEWRKAGYFNSKGQLTKAGWKAITKKANSTGDTHLGTSFAGFAGPPVSTSITRAAWQTAPAFELRQWAQAMTGTKRLKAGDVNKAYKMAKDNASSVLGKANIPVSRLALEQTEANTVADRILTAAGKEGTVYLAGDLGLNSQVVEGKGITSTSLQAMLGRDSDRKGNSRIMYLVNSPTTGQRFVQLVDGTVLHLPKDVVGLDEQLEMEDANTRYRAANSKGEVVTNLNRSNTAFASVLNSIKGTDIKPNEGTTIIDLE